MPSHPTLHARAWLEVDAGALVHNARVLRRAIPSETRLGLLVKANGYGHGIEIAARAAIAGGADQLMVATLDEGLALRRAGFAEPILVVYPVPRDGVGEAVAGDLEVSIAGVDPARRTLEGWAAARPAMTGDRRLRVHIEVDTGMGRGGVAPDELLGVIDAIEASPQVAIVGIWSHLSDGADPERSRAQVARYEAALEAVAATGRPSPVRHVAATEGVFAGTAPAYDMVRVGLAFYGSLGLGVRPAPPMAALAAELRPAMTVAARPIRVESVAADSPIGYGGEWTTERASRIATLPLGYADGWTRASWPGASALVRGRPVPLVGRVSMDSVCADVTDVDGVTADDEFVLLGAQGDARITVDDIARVRATIPNEVFCAFGGRLERRETTVEVG
jgi:alanine racemase